MLLDPTVIIIGGGLAQAGQRLLQPLRDDLATRIRWRPPPPVIPAQLGAGAGRLGAAITAWRLP